MSFWSAHDIELARKCAAAEAAYAAAEDPREYVSDDDDNEDDEISDEDSDDDAIADIILQGAEACKLRVTLPGNHQEITREDYLLLASKCIQQIVHQTRKGLSWGYETFNKKGLPTLTHLHIHWVGFTKWKSTTLKNQRNRIGEVINKILAEQFPNAEWTHSMATSITKKGFAIEPVQDLEKFLCYPMKQKHAHTMAYIDIMELPFEDVLHKIDLANAQWKALASSKCRQDELKSNKKSLADKIMQHFERTEFKPSGVHELHDAVDDYMVTNGFNVLPDNVFKTAFLIARRLNLVDKRKLKQKQLQMWAEYA